MQLELPIDDVSAPKATRLWVLAQDLSSYVPQKSKRLFIDPENGGQPFAPEDILLIKTYKQSYHLYVPASRLASKDFRQRERILRFVRQHVPQAKKMVTEIQDFLSIAVAPGKARACGVLSADPVSEARTIFEDLLLRRFLVTEETGLQLLALVERAHSFLVDHAHPGAHAALSEICANVLVDKWRSSNDERFLSWAQEYVTSASECFLASSLPRQANSAKRNGQELDRVLHQPTLPGLESRPLKYAGPGLTLQRVSGFPLLLDADTLVESTLEGSAGSNGATGRTYEFCGEITLSDQQLLHLASDSEDQHTRICVTASPHQKGFCVTVSAFDEFSLFAWGSESNPRNSLSRYTHLECKTLRIAKSAQSTKRGDVFVLEELDRMSEHSVIALAEVPGEGTAELAFVLPSALCSTTVFV